MISITDISSRKCHLEKHYRKNFIEKVIIEKYFSKLTLSRSYIEKVIIEKIIILSRNIDSQVLEKYRPPKVFEKMKFFEKIGLGAIFLENLMFSIIMRRFR